jgi:hypothetical protein
MESCWSRWVHSFAIPFGIAVLAVSTPVRSSPLVQQVSGALDHKGSIKITGSAFGSKTTAAPVVWDDASGSDVLKIWDGAYPDKLGQYNTAYHAPMRGVQPPHSHDARYIAGAHAASTGADSGYDVVLYKNVARQAYPFYLYASWYQRVDDKWTFGGDNNFKTFLYSTCCSPYTTPYWSISYGPPHPTSATDTGAQWIVYGETLTVPDVNKHNAWWHGAVNPMAGKWSKVEMAIKMTDQSSGYIDVWENGHQVMNYVGPTDGFPGAQRTVGIGGYARMQGYPGNWRYFDDVYVDTTLARVVLADKPTLSEATIIETQIPTEWSDGSITATVNLGQFTQGQTAYLFVLDSSGTPSAKGIAVTAGGSATMPSPPSGVLVQ